MFDGYHIEANISLCRLLKCQARSISGNKDIVCAVMERYELTFESTNPCMFWVLRKGWHDVVEGLLQSGFYFTVNDLNYAIANGDLKLLKHMLDLGVNPNKLQDQKDKFLLITVLRRCPDLSTIVEIVKMLLDAGADANVVDPDYSDRTPLLENIDNCNNKQPENEVAKRIVNFFYNLEQASRIEQIKGEKLFSCRQSQEAIQNCWD